MIWSTFALGGWWAIGFAFVYLIELITLCANPLHVMGVSESKVLAYCAFRGAPTLIGPAVWWDLSCWIMDFKKLLNYLLLSFWILTYASIVTPSSETITWRPTDSQKATVIALTDRYMSTPLWLNILVAAVLTLLLGGAAVGILGANSTAIWRVVTWTIPWTSKLAFVAYRLTYLALLYVVILHMTIGFQSLFGRVMARQARRAVSRYFGVVLCYAAIIVLLEWLLWHHVMGEYDKRLFRLNIPHYFLSAMVFLMFAVLFYQHHQGQRDDSQMDGLESAAMAATAVFMKPDAQGIHRMLGFLPKYTFLPILSLLIPVFVYFVLVPIAGLQSSASVSAHVANVNKQLDSLIADGRVLSNMDDVSALDTECVCGSTTQVAPAPAPVTNSAGEDP